MDFALSEEQQMLKKMARDFLEQKCTERFVRDMEADPRGYSPELWREIAGLGWLGLVFPEPYGGAGGSFLDLAALYEEMGRAMFPSPHLSTVTLCGQAILLAGSEDQKRDLLSRIARGELILALALTEPNGKWGPDGVTVRATAHGDAFVIDGTKLFVHDAHVADYILCVARTKDGSNSADGVSLFLVDSRSPGLHCTLLKTLAGENKQSELVFDGVRVSRSNMIGGLHQGWPPLEKALQRGAVMVCAEMAGAQQRMLEMTVDYAKTRVQFDQPIGVNQYVQEHCIQLLACADGSRWATYQAAWRLSAGMPCDMEVAIAKAWTSDAHEKACWRAHQVLAGIGYATKVGLLALYTRRAKVSQLYLGDAAYHRKRIAQEMDRWTLEVPRGKPLGLWEQGEPPLWP